jgi:hypothetical protein
MVTQNIETRLNIKTRVYINLGFYKEQFHYLNSGPLYFHYLNFRKTPAGICTHLLKSGANRPIGKPAHSCGLQCHKSLLSSALALFVVEAVASCSLALSPFCGCSGRWESMGVHNCSGRRTSVLLSLLDRALLEGSCMGCIQVTSVEPLTPRQALQPKPQQGIF